MIHTNKMILVPHEIIGDNESIAKYISNLDKEMLNILKNNSIPMDEKILKYNQILRRYQTVKQDVEKPFQIEVKQETSPKTESEPAIQTENSIQEAVLSTIPQKWHKQANMLLKYAMKNPHIKWSDKGEMIIEGNKIKGSNIVDLINDLTRDRKSSEQAIGADIFLKKLTEENIPREIIVNKKRLKSIEQDVFASPEADIPESKTIDTPRTIAKRNPTSHLIKNWSLLGR